MIVLRSDGEEGRDTVELNYKLTGILNIVLAGNGMVPVGEVMETAGLSRRALIYHLEKLNGCLAEMGVSPIEICRGQLKWDMREVTQVKLALSKREHSRYMMSKPERKSVIAIYAAVSSQPVCLDMLCRLFDVSRNTVLSEIAELKGELLDAGLLLNSSGRSGYRLEGDEITIRYYVMESYYKLDSEAVIRQIRDLFFKEAGRAAGRPDGKAVCTEEYSRLYEIVAESERDTSLRFNSNSISEAVIYLLLILIRSVSGFHACLSGELSDRAEYRAAGTILKRTEQELQIRIPEREQDYLTAVLLGSKVFDLVSQPGEGTMNLESFSRDIVDTFSMKACVRFDNAQELVNRLLIHVRPMYYRLKYKIKVKNVLTEEIRTRYRELYNLTDLAVKTIEPRYGLWVPEDEIAFLCVYIGGFMKRQISERKAGIPRILIVCNGGIGTSLLVREQVSSLLGSGYLYETRDQREAKPACFKDYQLVITTVDLEGADDHVVKVSPILSQFQQNRLLALSARMNGGGEPETVEDILNIVRQHANITDEGGLTNRLLSFFTHKQPSKDRPRAELKDVLIRESVRIARTVMEPEEAVCFGCQPLMEQKIVSERYAESIWSIMDTIGLYSEITSGILLAHGKPDEEVAGVGLTLALFSKPVVFERWNKEIRVIFTLATPDNEAHLNVLREMMKILKKEEVCKRLQDCRFEDEEEAYDYMRKQMAEESDERGTKNEGGNKHG